MLIRGPCAQAPATRVCSFGDVGTLNLKGQDSFRVHVAFIGPKTNLTQYSSLRNNTYETLVLILYYGKFATKLHLLLHGFRLGASEISRSHGAGSTASSV